MSGRRALHVKLEQRWHCIAQLRPVAPQEGGVLSAAARLVALARVHLTTHLPCVKAVFAQKWSQCSHRTAWWEQARSAIA